MDLSNIQKYVDNELSRNKISRDVTDIERSDFLKHFENHAIIKQQQETDKKQDEVIQQLRDNQERIVEAIE